MEIREAVDNVSFNETIGSYNKHNRLAHVIHKVVKRQLAKYMRFVMRGILHLRQALET